MPKQQIMNRYSKTACMLALLLGSSVQGGTPRRWSSSDEKFSFEASIFGIYGDTVDLGKTNGVVYRLPSQLLLNSDQELLRQIDTTRFQLKGGGSVSSTNAGYEWQSTKRAATPLKAEFYTYRKMGSASAVKLIIAPGGLSKKPERLTVLMSRITEIESVAKSMRISDIKKEIPDVDKAIPSVVRYSLSGTPPIKVARSPLPATFAGVLIFSPKKTYVFETLATDTEEAKDLLSVSESLIEE